MPAPTTTLLVEGNFPDLINELVEYVDSLKKNQTQNSEDAASSPLKSEIEGPLGQYTQAEEAGDQEKLNSAREDVLKIIIPAASSVLNTAPERGSFDQELTTNSVARTNKRFLPPQNSSPHTTSSSTSSSPPPPSPPTSNPSAPASPATPRLQ